MKYLLLYHQNGGGTKFLVSSLYLWKEEATSYSNGLGLLEGYLRGSSGCTLGSLWEYPGDDFGRTLGLL